MCFECALFNHIGIGFEMLYAEKTSPDCACEFCCVPLTSLGGGVAVEGEGGMP